MINRISFCIFLNLLFNFSVLGNQVDNQALAESLTIKRNDIPINKKTAKFASDVWPGFTDTSGEGLYWDIIRKVYKDNNIAVAFESTNYIRSVALVKKNIFHAYIGAYLNEVDFAIYPKYPIDVDYISACTAVTNKEKINIENIAKSTVGWIKGYSFEKIFDRQLNYQEITNRKTGITLIENARIEYYIDAYSDIKHYFESAPLIASKIRCETIHHENIYLAFNTTPYAIQLKNIWDKTIPKLIQSGYMEKIYREHGLKPLPESLKDKKL